MPIEMSERSSAPTGLRALQHAFALLASVELGHPPTWSGPSDAKALRTRVEFLAVALNVMPRSQRHRLEIVVDDWLLAIPPGTVADTELLRQRARTVLLAADVDAAAQRSIGDEFAWIAQMFDVRTGGERRRAARQPSEATKVRCAELVESWCRTVRSDPEWTDLPSVVPGQVRTPITEIYVDLRVSPRTCETSGSPAMDRLNPLGDAGAIDIMTMVSQTFRNCVVLGEPGSGKSTVFQWLAWAAHGGQLRDFDGAIAIRLPQYSESLRRRPRIRLLDFFLEGVRGEQAPDRYVSECFRQAVKEHGRLLLLLDGWDEVPAEQRDEVTRAVHRDRDGLVVVLTSRISGSPWTLFPADKTDYYEIAGLSSAAVAAFVGKQLATLGRSELRESITQRLIHAQEFRSLTANPFLLGLLVRMLSGDPDTQRPISRVQLYEQIVQWMVEQHNARADRGRQLTSEHLQALERLSFRMVLGEPSPQFVFPRAALDRELSRASSDPIVESRFVHKLDPVFDVWSFLHATFQELFAARQLATLEGDRWEAVCERALVSQTRLVTLGFLAGIRDSNSGKLRGLATRWLDKPDRFHVILGRIGVIAARGGWVDAESALAARIEDQLWQRLTTESQWLRALPLLHAFAELDPREVLRRAARKSPSDSRIWEVLCECLPPELIRGSELLGQLPKALREKVMTRAHRPESGIGVEPFVARLSDFAQPVDQYLRLLDEAACVPDRRIAECLLQVLQQATDERIATRIVMALSGIYSVLPIGQSMAILVDEPLWPSTLRKLAATALSHASQNDGKLLDTAGRDRLLCRLASLPPSDPRLDSELLLALRGFPIREGGSMIAELALDDTLATELRRMAVCVLHTVADQATVNLVAGSIVNESCHELRTQLLELAVSRGVALDRQWMEAQIEVDDHSWRRGSLTAAYVHATNQAVGESREAHLSYLLNRINLVFAQHDDAAAVVAYELARAFFRLDRTSWIWEREAIREPAFRFLEQFVGQRGAATAGQVRLAVSLLRFTVHRRERELVCQSLDELLRRMRFAKDKQTGLELESQAHEVARIVADLAVERLLKYPRSCEPVEEVLAERARDFGWVVFEDRIFDANGRQLANLQVVEQDETEIDHKAILSLVRGLADAKRNAILSRWLVVRVFNLQPPRAELAAIHCAIQKALEGEHGTHAEDWMREVYPDGAPELKLWRQYMYRAAEKLRLLPNGPVFLAEVGLPPAKRRSRK